MNKFRYIIGQEYLTRGGWKCIVIWVARDGAWVIHRPDDTDESNPIYHDEFGRAQEIFSVGAIPSFGQHPADIIKVWQEEKVANAHEREPNEPIRP